MKFDGIIFDLDGTLWDACRSVAESWRATLIERFGARQTPSLAEIQGIMGMTAAEIARKLFSNIGADPAHIFEICAQEECHYLAVHGGTIYPGVEEMLQVLSKQHPLFLVSNCQDGYIEGFFQYSGFGRYFKGYECEGHSKKPKAENIRETITRYQLSSPVYIGDTEMDEASAGLAECPFIHAAYGFGTAKQPLAAINTPLDLIKVIDHESI